MNGSILTLNAGSSSLKFSLYDNGDELSLLAAGQVEALGIAPQLHINNGAGETLEACKLDKREAATPSEALSKIIATLKARIEGPEICAVGHRVVHGGSQFLKPVRTDDSILENLAILEPLAPLHQPHNLAGIRAARKHFPAAVQVACFDTSFHRSHAWINDTFALPRRYYDKGIRRYGFHGLSYEYVTLRLYEMAPALAAGRVVIAHLGNGASMCAVRDGQSVGSTMGFSALDGLPMGTRCGQIDPGVLLYLMQHDGLNCNQLQDLLYRESGLKGLSGLSPDMRILEASELPSAEEAIAYFVSRIQRELGAMAAILQGLDAVVFCGGIGEHSDNIRDRICQGMCWLGLHLDEARNRTGEAIISSETSRVKALVIPTNEELMIARHTRELLERGSNTTRAET